MRYLLPLLLLCSLSACQGSNSKNAETPHSLSSDQPSAVADAGKMAGPPSLRELPPGMPTPPPPTNDTELPALTEDDVRADVRADFEQYLDTGEASLFLLSDDQIQENFGQGFATTLLPSRVSPNNTTAVKLEQRRSLGDISITDVSVQKLQLHDPNKHPSPFKKKRYMVHSARVHFMQGNEPMVLELRNGLHTDEGWRFVMLQFVRP